MGVTIKDIAKEANVSISTVSRVINRKDKGVGENTKKRVVEVIKRLNYLPNNAARSLVIKKTHVMGVIIPDITNPFFPELIRGIEDTASRWGYSILLCNSDDNIKKERKYFNLLKSKGVDGIIYAGANSNTEEEVGHLSLPMVFLDRVIQGRACSYVCDDGEYGMYTMVNYLIGSGHREIAYFGGNMDVSTEQERKKGYIKALKEHGIKVNDGLIFKGNFDIKSGRENIEILLSRKISFTAIACANDAMAIGAIAGLNKNNIQVPNQISVTGYDDIEMAKYCYPPLTTMAQDKYTIGKTIVELLVRVINGEQKENISLELRSKLMERDSVIRRGDYREQ